MEYNIKPIGLIHSCYREKFGIPRQPGLVKNATGMIEMLSPCNREEMFKELDSFSHIWLQFLFHEAVSDGWRPTVRPPWLGGQKRVGLFASRSPHRPNFLGLSVVRYHGLRKEKAKLFLDISGLDLLDGTPIIDIKPYIPYSDTLEDATSGFVQFAEKQVVVTFTSEAESACLHYRQTSGRDLKALICEVLEQDPRPASQRQKQREYGMLLWEMNIRWLAEKMSFTVFSVQEERVEA
ncbi:MAG: tRNA (N6-threonylcarbamoyladenosine(37)-N6)-methyltransferase TrmO [Desulfocapsa sp.]|nr:tRNA (N6-threonylcarbamoyladenosine(37)-N6)-methyltransferase TrmO [Desulfocapsa sp.]MBN4060114.1 tRNA (N6-threonylcarbamoyladenosine(37)-N6)-methyltransferase TrmO [Desulfotalea psychrophila]